ncbi:MAG: SMC-Scp complex subunit ScpB, partial [Pseudomonadota bacterium]|nr:SMC-Scp complex subunit ScpB [Pseudomonadota bacterium]
MTEDVTEMNADMTGDARLLEAILFATAEPLSTETLVKQFGSYINIPEALIELKSQYATRGVNLVETDGQWSFRTAPDLAGRVKITRASRRKLPRAAAEVLA